MDHNDNGLRIKIKVRNGNAAATVDDDNDGNKQFCSIGHMRFDSETTMEKGLLFQPPTPVTTNQRSASSSSFSSSSSSSSSAVSDCSISLPSWSLTGRRGRKRNSSTTATTATAAILISDDLLGKKRTNIETHYDHERSPKRKVHSEENKNVEKEYKCNICSKIFSSPRALGGHKSSHYKANKTDIAITKETVNTTIGTTLEPKITLMLLDSSTDQTGRKRVMDFDLNQLPPDEEAIIESCVLHL